MVDRRHVADSRGGDGGGSGGGVGGTGVGGRSSDTCVYQSGGSSSNRNSGRAAIVLTTGRATNVGEGGAWRGALGSSGPAFKSLGFRMKWRGIGLGVQAHALAT